MRKFAVLLFAGALAFVPARADIERKATVSCEGEQTKICFYIWPALPEMPGWHNDEEASYRLSANVLVPDGHSFDDTNIILTGNAVPQEGYRTDHPGPSAVDSFIQDDVVQTRKDNPDAVITEQEPLVTADGGRMRAFLIVNLRGGHRQIVAFGEDGDADGRFFVILMIDSSDEEVFNANVPAFRQMVAKYKHYSENH